jgi:hypothetical protein
MSRDEQLLRDCHVLFGPGIHVDMRFLDSLEMSHLKSAFRRRALATHPDLFVNEHPESRQYRNDLFISARESYQRLCQFVASQASRRAFQWLTANYTNWASGAPSSTFGSSFHRNPFTPQSRYSPNLAPWWPLRTGEYLYYTKVINWKLLVNSLVWQKQHRPRIGDIAQRWGWISEEEIRPCLFNRPYGFQLGRVLVWNGLISEYQLGILLARQSQLQKPIGRYYILQNCFSEFDFQRYLHDLRVHNHRWRK